MEALYFSASLSFDISVAQMFWPLTRGAGLDHRLVHLSSELDVDCDPHLQAT